MDDWAWIVGVCAGVALVVLAHLFRVTPPKRITIFEHQRGIRYRLGRFTDVLLPGAYWYWPRNTSIVPTDIRLRVVTVPGQEVLSSDGISVKVSLAAQFSIVDPARAINGVEDCLQALYVFAQLSLREVVGGIAAEQLLAQRETLGHRVLELCKPKAAALGLELHALGIKDLTFPGELKKIFAQVVKAQKEGLAALERARGETAALRNLANAAHLVEDNPALLQLRMLQPLGDSSGNTVVLGMPHSATPIPLRARGPSAPGPQIPPPESGS